MAILTCKQIFECIPLQIFSKYPIQKSRDGTNPPDLPTLKAYPTPGVGGRFGMFSLKSRERVNLKVPGAILPLGCAILSTRAKTVRRTRVKKQRLAKIYTLLWLLLSTQISQVCIDSLQARYAGEKANITQHICPVVDPYRPLLALPQKAGSFKFKLACIGGESGQFQIAVSVRIVWMKRKSGRVWFLVMPYQSL